MAARRQINRYRTAPSGTDFNDVLKRGKVFHRNSFDGCFMVWKYKDLWNADTLPADCFTIPETARVYRWNGKRWEEVTEEFKERKSRGH